MSVQINELLQKEISRKDFLRLIGVGLLAVGGINSLLKSFEHLQKSPNRHGYGSTPYGR